MSFWLQQTLDLQSTESSTDLAYRQAQPSDQSMDEPNQTPTSSPNEMEPLPIVQLPELCLRKIFICLGLRDLAKARAVCRLFKLHADQAGVRKLIVADNRSDRRSWFLTREPLPFGDSISWKAFASLHPTQFSLNRRLKFLFLGLPAKSDFNFEKLNGFEQLIHLEIEEPFIFEPTDPREFTLINPKLKVLSVRSSAFPSLGLKTARLEVLRYTADIGAVELEFPESIKRLYSDYAGAAVMAKFKTFFFQFFTIFFYLQFFFAFAFVHSWFNQSGLINF